MTGLLALAAFAASIAALAKAHSAEQSLRSLRAQLELTAATHLAAQQPRPVDTHAAAGATRMPEPPAQAPTHSSAPSQAPSPTADHIPPSPTAPVPAAHPRVAAAAATPAPAARASLDNALQQPGSQVDVGSRALAVGGGVIVLIGVALLVSLAIGSGWLTPERQVVGGYLLAVLLSSAGTMLRRRSAVDPAVSELIIGAGLGAAQLTTVAATRTLDVLTPSPALLIAILIGAAAMSAAVRLASVPLAAFGIVTGLAAPVLVGASPTTATLGLLSVAFVGALAASAAMRWSWLLTVSMLVTAPQLAAWVIDTIDTTSTTGTMAFAQLVTVAWALAGSAAACLTAASAPQSDRPAPFMTLLATAAVATGLVVATFQEAGAGDWAPLGLLALAALYGAGAAVVHRALGASFSALAHLLAALSLSLVAGAAGLHFTEVALVAAWAVQATALIALWARRGVAWTGWLGVAIGALASLTAVPFEAAEALLWGFAEPLTTLNDLTIICAALAATALVVHRGGPWTLQARMPAIAACAATAWYLVSVTLVSLVADSTLIAQREVDPGAQLALSLLWAVVGVAALAAARRVARDTLRLAGFTLLGASAVKLILVDTAQLPSSQRVASFLAVGVALLIGAVVSSRDSR